MRAYSYFYLVKIFGGVPIPESYTSGLEGLEIPRKSVEEVYTYLIADLEYCESVLPQRGMADYDVWRISKGAAQGLLSEVYLYRASMEGNKDFYQKCADYCKKIVDSGIYQLMPNYLDLWYAFNPTGAKNNMESLLELQYAAVSGEDNSMHRMFGTFGDSYYNAEGGSYFYLRTGLPSMPTRAIATTMCASRCSSPRALVAKALTRLTWSLTPPTRVIIPELRDGSRAHRATPNIMTSQPLHHC